MAVLRDRKPVAERLLEARERLKRAMDDLPDRADGVEDRIGQLGMAVDEVLSILTDLHDVLR